MKTVKRTLAVLLTLLMLMSVVPVGVMNVMAANSFPKIPALNISRVYQSNSSASLCTWCSMATVQGYCLGEFTYGGKTTSYRVPGNDYEYGAAKGKRDAVTAYLKDNFNDYYNTASNLKKYPFPMEMKKNPGSDVYKMIYNQLSAGKPVIVYRKGKNSNESNHASVVIGYNGSKSTLEPSGFTIMEINRNVTKNNATLFEKYANNPQTKYSTSCYLKLSTWLDGREVLHIIYPKVEVISNSKTLTVYLRDTSHIETNAATVHLTAWNPEKKLITARGVQVKKKGASSWEKTYSEDLSKKAYNKDTIITGYFDIGSGKEVNYALSAKEIYEYRCFVTSGGKNYYSSISTFETLPDNPQPTPTDDITATWSNYSVKTISATNAEIRARVTFNKSVKHEKCGFYFGTQSGKLTKNAKYDTINKNRTYTEMWYDLNKFGQTLKAGTKYYYQFYIVANGKEYRSAEKTLSLSLDPTPSNAPSWSKYNASNITETNAKIEARVTFNKSVKHEKCGFYFGTQSGKLTKNSKYDTINKSRKYTDMWYDLNKWYGKLTPGTTYYYQFFIVANGTEYKSDEKSFQTKGGDYNFTVKYNANGGTGTMADQSAKGGQTCTLAANSFEKAGYTFDGWNVKRGSDSKWFVSGQGWKTESDISKNKWTKKVYGNGITFTFDSSWSSGAKPTDTFTFYAVWKECEHVWNDGIVTKEPTTKATGVKTFTCERCGKTKTEKIPKITAFAIKYVANGGKGTMAGTTVQTGDTFTLPECAFTKGGAFFSGWAVKRSSDSKWYTTNGTWETAKAITTNGLSKEVFDAGTEYELNEEWINGSKNTDTYSFYAIWIACEHEWDDGEVTKEPTTKATGVMTYTCELCGTTKTEKIPKLTSYQIKYAANGGKGTMTGTKVLKDDAFTLSECEFTRSGYTFNGWMVKRTSDSKWLTEEDSWKTDKTIKADDLTKAVFDSDTEICLDEDWINGTKNVDTYTFYAVWVKE